MTPEERKDRIIQALNQNVFKGSELAPMVIAVEDLHWINKSSEQLFNLSWYIRALSAASRVYSHLGLWDEAFEEGPKALSVAEEFSDNSLISFAACVICQAYCLKGKLDRVIKYGELAVQKAPTPGDKIWAQGFLAMEWCRAGKLHRGIETLAKVVGVHKKGRFRFGEVGYTIMFGVGYFLAGE